MERWHGLPLRAPFRKSRGTVTLLESGHRVASAECLDCAVYEGPKLGRLPPVGGIEQVH